MKWTKMPDESGWWFYTKELYNWDVPELISISKYCYNKPEFRSLITSDLGFWYGPFKVKCPEIVGINKNNHYIYKTDDPN